MNTLNEILQEKKFSLKFKPTTRDFTIESIGCDDFQYVQEIPFFRRQPFYTLHYVLRGKGFLFFRGKIYEVCEGQFFVLPINENIKYIPDKADPWKYFWFDFSGSLAHEFFHELYADSPVISGVPKEECYAMFEGLFQELASNATARYYAVLSCFYGILNKLAKQEAKTEKISFTESAKQFMELNFRSADFTVDVLCKMLHISHSYLCKIFKREAGMTLKSYLILLRVNEAVRLLKTSNATVKEIAFQVGFSDEVNFMKIFKQYISKTPSECRKP